MSAIDWSTFVPAWLAEALPAGLLITDATLTIRHWRPWLAQGGGRPAADLVGRPLLEAFPELGLCGLDNAFQRALAGETVELAPCEHHYLLAVPQGAAGALPATPLQHARIAPLYVDRQLVGTLTLIVALSENDPRLVAAREAQAAAEAALRRHDGFLSLAAHELRTPLTALLGRAQLLQKWLGEAGDERARRSADIIVEQARRLNTMLTTLLEVSRLQSGRLALDCHRLDLAALTWQVLAEQEPAGEQQIVVEIPEAPLHVLGDKARLEQALRGLLVNAVRYSPEDGRILVRVVRHGDEARLSVADQGIGIPADDLAQLFEGPFRGRNAERLGHKGLGADLFVAARIMKLHQGALEVVSAEGQGSTFLLRLPLAAGAPQSPGA